jgi:hypothetical protein
MSLKTWDDYFDSVSTFITTNNYVPRYNDFSGIPITTTQIQKVEHDLGVWCSFQRKLHQMGGLPIDRFTQLNNIDEWIWEIDTRWVEKMVLVQWYMSVSGRKPSPHSTKNDPFTEKLSNFLSEFEGKKNIPKHKNYFLEQIPNWTSG